LSNLYGIIGTSFCGSTLLSFILGSNECIFATSELNTLVRQKENTKCSICGKKCKFWTKEFVKHLSSNLDYRYNIVSEEAKAKFEKHITIISDKHPKTYKNSMWCTKFNGFITLFKRPEAYVNSCKIHLPKNSIINHLRAYTETYQQALNMKNNQFIFYDDLAINPESIIEDICQKIGVVYTPTMLEFWNYQHHTLGGNSGTHMHVWSKEKRDGIINSKYWGEEYSKEHTKWIKENYRSIKLDEKWKTQLSEKDKRDIKNYKESQDIFNQLLSLRKH